MTVRFPDIRGWEGEPLATGARRAAEAGERVRAALAALIAAGPDTTAWHGEGAWAAARQHQGLLEAVGRLAGVVAEVETALTVAAGRAQSVGDLARSAERLAERHGLVVTDSGLVLDPLAALDAGPAPQSSDVDRLVRQALAEADRADADLLAALVAVEDGLSGREGATAPPASRVDATATAVAGPVSVAVVPPPVTPGRTATPIWWNELSPDARRSAVDETPELVGPTDGLPGWARDQANRLLLTRAEHDLALDVERLRPPPGGGVLDLAGGLAGAATIGTLDGPSRRAAYLHARTKLAAVRHVIQVLDQADGRGRQLLVLDTLGGSVKAAVAVGDVDLADHVAVLVPGFTTTVEGDLAGSDAVAADLRTVARRESMAWGDLGEVAVVSWLGYDAPQAADSLRSRSVVLRGSAETGAAALGPFLGGLRDGAHLTVVGHSYGSTTAGLAVAVGGTGVDDLVVIGSPGIGVRSATALGLPPARVHVIEAVGDPVADLGWFGPDPEQLAGVDLLAADSTPLPDGSAGLPSRGHSQYLTPGTTSQWNVAAVVVGTATVPAARARELRVG